MKDGAVAGVVYHPVGAVCGGERERYDVERKSVRVRRHPVEHAMISFDRARKKKSASTKCSECGIVQSQNGICCTALELGFVARGGTEGFICLGLNKWDYAAGVLLVEEAGGKITDWEGNPWRFGSSDYFIASNGKIHDALLALAKMAV